MSHEYYYVKDFDVNSAVLMDILRLSTLKPKLENLKIEYNADTSLMGIIHVYMNEVLVSEDEDILIGIINDYTLTCEMQIRYNIETELINPAMSYGREMLAKFGTNNVYRQKTDEQIQGISESFQPLILDLLTGSLKQAYYKALALEASESTTQEEIDEFQQRIGWFLGL